MTAFGWRATFRGYFPDLDRGIKPLEGQRGAGERAGVIGIAEFPAGVYPACSEHGAMNCVKRATEEHGSFWRCLAEGCNVGLEWEHHG